MFSKNKYVWVNKLQRDHNKVDHSRRGATHNHTLSQLYDTSQGAVGIDARRSDNLVGYKFPHLKSSPTKQKSTNSFLIDNLDESISQRGATCKNILSELNDIYRRAVRIDVESAPTKQKSTNPFLYDDLDESIPLDAANEVEEFVQIVPFNQPSLRFPSGTNIILTPTTITKVNQFYAQICFGIIAAAPIVWKDSEVFDFEILKELPVKGRLVRAQYLDGMWYRARVVNIDAELELIDVFYVDYGNREWVRLNQMAWIERKAIEKPLQAVLCDISNIVVDTEAAHEQISNGIAFLNSVILNRKFTAEVISHRHDMKVRFSEENIIKIMKRLIQIGCAQSIREREPPILNPQILRRA